ncbi:enhanced level of genomic instability 1 isoform X2 [Calliopsis andreniformis]|uniref:enhanced level of genomic instability 1 isoform X2 n=1 Tax=Calliopsis andreniformis TaxID=337506 RepID=UPI003FCE4683
MKNITQYFMDTVKPSENATITSDGEVIKETDSKKGSNGKRNRVKIKISRTNAKERVCDIIDSNKDMIDKTPSPFTRKNNVDKNSNETPKRSSFSKLSVQTRNKKSEDQNLEDLSLKTNNGSDNKGKQNKKNHLGNSVDETKNNKRKLGNPNNINSSMNTKNMCKDEEDFVDLVSDDSNDKDRNNCEGSNAFQILMSRNKVTQQISPTKLTVPNEEVNIKKSEESKERLRRSKEKLIALADKKGYSKRKLEELEEGERVEQIIQNRIKILKMEGKKNDNENTPVLSQKQPPGSLLNYFSKTPVDITNRNAKDISTIIVKADVHVSEDSVKPSFLSSDLKTKIRPIKKNRPNLNFCHVDDISIIESENISTSLNNKQERNKQKWSLRIKLQTYENENSLSGYSSDEELFSPKSKAKLGMENLKRSELSKSLPSENLSIKNKSKKRTAKPMNDSKLKLKRQEQESPKDEDKIQNGEHLKAKIDNKNNIIKSVKDKSTLVHKKSMNNCTDISLRNKKSVTSNQEDCIIINDDNLQRKSTDKLAPLFIKRQKPDPETIAARRLFLQSDITDKSSKSTDHKVNVCNTLPFPVISHITQLNKSDSNKMNSFNILEKVSDQYVPTFNVNDYKFIMDFSEVKSKSPKNINKPKVQEVLIEIEKNCSDVKKMWDTVSLAVKGVSTDAVSPKTRTKRGKQTEKREGAECRNKNQIENCCWTYKYRPKKSEEVVGNEEAAAKLREWLIGWRATFTNENVSSSDEFYSTDCSSDVRINENNQVAVLLGPYGSGKTASVYAVAEEFGYTVLEVNASSKRSGKKLLKELEEATKSHRIKKEKTASTFFNSASDEVVPKKIPQNSLILIEDVDLIFEEDEGFISATYQLASNTKRPIVMTCRDVYPHLSKMAPQQNRIYFQNAFGNRVFALLELISLAETGYRLPSNCVTELLQSGDLRRAILQLQYLLLSGPLQTVNPSMNFKSSLWQNMRYYLYKPAIKMILR